MSRPQTVYKICASAFLCALVSACVDGGANAPVDAEPEAPLPPAAGGMGGSMPMGAPSGGSNGEPTDEPVEPATDCPEFTSGFATEVLSFEFGKGQDFGRDQFPELVLGGPHGGGLTQGSLHVTSLGDGGTVVLGFSPRTIVDGEGPDLLVFENPFYAGGDPNAPVAELGVVAVSLDGEEWHEFPCESGDVPPYAPPPYPGCAGWTPVEADISDAESVSPFDSSLAGGEAYDLADLGLTEAKFVRITDLAGDDVVFDLDAVAIVNGRCE